MKIVTGGPVSGKNFFYRKNVVEEAWEQIESGSHILIAAPRRVGKTSLMFYLRDNPKKGYNLIHMIIESEYDENSFFKRVFEEIIETEFVKITEKTKVFFQKHIPGIKKIGTDGVEFEKRDELKRHWIAPAPAAFPTT